MAKKSGQARVPKPEDWERLFQEIKAHRHPEKNSAIMRISQRLGLRVQEISLLQVKEVAKLFGKPGSSNRSFKRFEILTLPAAITKGANATGRSQSKYSRKRISFTVSAFEKMLKQVCEMNKAGINISPEDFYPEVLTNKGKSRDLPLVDPELCDAIDVFLEKRLNEDPYLQPNDPLFISQKGGPYSPNTLQEHIAMMLRDWTGIEKATSHSGRRALITNIIHHQGKSIKIAQKVAGHQSPSTTVIYEEPPEHEIADALNNLVIKQ